MVRSVSKLRDVSRISERAIPVFAALNKECGTELHILANMYQQHQLEGEILPQVLSKQEWQAYQAIIHALAKMGAEPVAGEILFAAAKYSSGIFGLAASVLTLPTSRILSTQGIREDRQQVSQLLRQIGGPPNSRTHIGRMRRSVVEGVVENTEKVLVWLGDTTDKTSEVAENAMRATLLQAADSPTFQPILAYIIGMYAVLYRRAVNEDGVKAKVSFEEERVQRFENASLVLKQILQREFCDDHIGEIKLYALWLTQQNIEPTESEAKLLHVIRIVTQGNSKFLLHQKPCSDVQKPKDFFGIIIH